MLTQEPVSSITLIGELNKAKQEIAILKQRLEVESRHTYDGIYCRDETIKLQDERLKRQEKIIRKLRKALRSIACTKKTCDCGLFRVNGMTCVFGKARSVLEEKE